MNKSDLSPVFFTLLLAAFLSPTKADPEYDVVDLSLDRDTLSAALDVNEFNEVTGIAKVLSSDGTQYLRTAFVHRNGSTQLLSPALKDRECLGLSINDSGVVAGCTYISDIDMVEFDRVYHACYWKGNEIHDLGTFGGYRAMLCDVNNKGQFVGWFSVQTEEEYYEVPFLYSNGICSPLNIPESVIGHESRLYIKSLGYEYIEFDDHPKEWTRNLSISINDSGNIVASFLSSERSNFSILWTTDSIKMLCPENPDSTDTLFLALGLNEERRIFGSAIVPSSGNKNKGVPALWNNGELQALPGPFDGTNNAVWDSGPNGIMFGTIDSSWPKDDLIGACWRNDSILVLDSLIEPSEGVTISSVYSVNESGILVGAGRKADGKLRAVMLYPRKKQVVLPTYGKVTVTLTKASTKLVSDIYLVRPDSILLIENNLTNVGKTVDTVYRPGTTLRFAIGVHGPDGLYFHYSESRFARMESISPTEWNIHFEDLPQDEADWDYDDVIINVKLDEVTETVVGTDRNRSNRNCCSQMSPNAFRVHSSNSQSVRMYSLNGRRITSSNQNEYRIFSAARGAYITTQAEDRRREVRKLLLR